ncbi:AAA family ATPase [Candidatus Sumerlaeota bacterium]|nr:AAA family ATPase [Candidatus Sumerlaeota bacterium]
MFIRRVTIKNFKRLVNVDDVELRPFLCVVGANNSGKTTLLQALALSEFCVHQCLSRKSASNGETGPIEIKNRSLGAEEFFALPLAKPDHLWADRVVLRERQPRVMQIRVVFDNDVEVTSEVKLSFNRLGISVDSSDESQEWLEKMKNLRISYLPVFSSFLAQEERRTRVAIEEELARGRVSSVIRNLLVDLREKQREEELIQVLRRAFPELEQMAIAFDDASDRYISVTYKEKGRPKEFDVFSAGSGFQQFIYLLGFILLREPQIILLDEPDVHLHGSLQKTLLKELRCLVDQGKQVLFATHSPDLIMQMEPENVLSLENGEPRPLSVAFDKYDVLNRMGSLDIAEIPKVQAYRRVLVVEDKSDLDFVALFCGKILGQSVWQRIEQRLAVCFAKGNPCTQSMIRLREQIQQMLQISGEPLKMFVVADRDYHPDLEYLYRFVEEPHLQWHIWERAEVENYLLSLPALEKVLRVPNIEGTFMEVEHEERFERIRQEFDRLVDASQGDANDRLVKAYQEYARSKKESWDVSTCSKMSRKYIEKNWSAERLALADAKEAVLPGLKRWLQQNGSKQFSDKALAEALSPEDLPDDIHAFARKLSDFSDVPTEPR